MKNYNNFLFLADQFFVSYSVQPSFPAVKLFEIGHTVELYLKAAHTKFQGNPHVAIKSKHEIKAIWDECKKDTTFMPNYEIRESIYNSDFIRDTGMSLSPDDVDHYFRNQELYVIAKYLKDIKYIGVFKQGDKLNNGSVWIMQDQNPYWISFFKELRNYLNWPSPRYRDWIKWSIDENRIPDDSKIYLRNLYE